MNSQRPRARAAILISGRGSNMELIHRHSTTGNCHIDIVGVISNRADAAGLKYAHNAQLPTFVIEHNLYKSRAAFDLELQHKLVTLEVDLIILAGFMRILGADFTNYFAGKIVNIHPSLLPKYQGMHTHQRALSNNDADHGASVHIVTANLDAGPVIAQTKVAIKQDDNAHTLAARVLAAEHHLYYKVVNWLARGIVYVVDGQLYVNNSRLQRPVVFKNNKIEQAYEYLEQ